MYTLRYFRCKNGKDVDFSLSASSMRQLLRDILTLVREADQAGEHLSLHDIVSTDGLEMRDIPTSVLAKAFRIIGTQLAVLNVDGWYEDEWMILYDEHGKQWDLNLYTYGKNDIAATIYPVVLGKDQSCWCTDTLRFCTIFYRKS